jgi:hypothetical protein
VADDLVSYVGSIPENYDRYRATDFEPYADDLAGRMVYYAVSITSHASEQVRITFPAGLGNGRWSDYQ